MIVSITRIVCGDDTRCVFWASDPNDALDRYVANQTLPRCPVVGECWSLEYVPEDHPDFGIQRRVTAGTLQRASGTYLVHLLSRHPALRGLGMGVVTARKLNEVHPDLVNILAAGSADALPELDKDIAFELCERWRDLALEPDVIRWLDEHTLPTRIASQVLAIYGAEAVTVMESNPYVLLPFLPFTTLDKVARNSLGMEEHDPCRLVACVENILYKDIDRGNTAILRADLLGALRDSLSGLAEEAIHLALQQTVIFAQCRTHTGLSLTHHRMPDWCSLGTDTSFRPWGRDWFSNAWLKNVCRALSSPVYFARPKRAVFRRWRE